MHIHSYSRSIADRTRVSKLLYYCNSHLLSRTFYLGSESSWKATTSRRRTGSRSVCEAPEALPPSVHSWGTAASTSLHSALHSWACLWAPTAPALVPNPQHIHYWNKFQDFTYLFIIYNLQSSPGGVTDWSRQPLPTCPSYKALQSLHKG